MRWRIHHMDVKTTFLNEIIEVEVYIEKPQGFEVHGRESHVCRFKKALYGLKHARRAWYSRIDGYLQSMGFIKREVDPNLYFILVGSNPLILVLYVDDLFLIGVEELIAGAKEIWLQSSVEAKYMVASMANCEAIWLRKLLTTLFDQELDPTVIYCDNQSCVKLSENPVFHDNSKHIEIEYHIIQDRIQKGVV
jgi:hypothetical protein